MRTDSKKNDILFEHLKVLCIGYSTGNFEGLFPLLSDDCVFESQWVLTPNTGKDAVIEYFTGKGATLQKNGTCPECTIVKFIGNVNMIRNADIHLNGEESKHGSLGLWYPENKLAMLMCQHLNGEVISVIVDIQLDGNDLISRIDLCDPAFFKFEHYAGPFTTESETSLSVAKIEEFVRGLLIANPDSFEEVDEFIKKHEDEHPDGLADYVFRLAIQMGNIAYVEEHADNFDLNDGDGYSTYLNETDDEDMQDILMRHGAFRSWDDYDDCKFAMETVNGAVLTFDEEFQKEVYKKYKKEFGLSDKKIRSILEGDEDSCDYDRDIETDMEALGVSFEDDKISFNDKCYEDGYELMDILEELGWDCDFEGDSWKLETAGVYFIK